MEYFFHLFLLLVYFISNEATELTFELPDNQKQCFFEKIDKGVKSTLEFQVITGGQYDVDLELVAPNGQILYKDVKKQYDSFTWNADQTGIHKFCFSNEFSTFSHKVVYFDLEVGEEKPIVQEMAGNAHATAMTLMETGCVEIHEALKYIADGQTHYRLREAQGRIFAQTLNSHVLYWSLGMTLLIMIVSAGQVFVLRGFFSEKKSTIKPTVLS